MEYFWAAAVVCDVITGALILKSELKTRGNNVKYNSAGDTREHIKIFSLSSHNILCNFGA